MQVTQQKPGLKQQKQMQLNQLIIKIWIPSGSLT